MLIRIANNSTFVIRITSYLPHSGKQDSYWAVGPAFYSTSIIP